jgi:hypothetical protein
LVDSGDFALQRGHFVPFLATSVDDLGATHDPKIKIMGGIFRAGTRDIPPVKLIKRQQCPDMTPETP